MRAESKSRRDSLPYLSVVIPRFIRCHSERSEESAFPGTLHTANDSRFFTANPSVRNDMTLFERLDCAILRGLDFIWRGFRWHAIQKS